MMVIERRIKELLAEYASKLSDCNTLIEVEDKRNRDARRAGTDQHEHQLVLRALWAKQRAYWQAVVDIESLLDEVVIE